MFAKNFHNFFLAILLIFCSGCRLINWGTQTFYQGCHVETCLDIPRSHIRTVRIYDQFSTLGIFSAMWLSDAVLQEYTKLHAEKNAFDCNAATNFLERQRTNFSDYISFYILGYDPKAPDGPLLFDIKNEIPWKIFLKINDVAYEPTIIKEVELNQEFRLFFGKLYTRFKTAYLVQFQLSNLEDEITSPIVLCFSSIRRKAALVWHIDNMKVVNEYDQYGDCCCIHEQPQVCEICKCVKVKSIN